MNKLLTINRRVLLALALCCLLGLTGVQVAWIFRAAHMQEIQFKHSVGQALDSFSEKIANDKQLYTIIRKCAHTNETYEQVNRSYLSRLSRIELHRVDSMIRSDLKLFGIELDFSFDIVDSPSNGSVAGVKAKAGNYSYLNDINNLMESTGLSLMIQFPRKRAFLAAQVGPEFISALLLIGFTSIAFFMVYAFFKKEQVRTAHMRDFINNMTHELKTPLASISFSNKLILKDPQMPTGKLVKYAGIIAEETERIHKQVEEILELARMDAQTTETQYELLEPNDTVRKARENMQALIEETSANVQLNLCTNCGFVRGQQLHLLNSISNLIENAIKYCTRPPQISIESRVQDNNYLLSISDNGIGIANEDQAYIFDQFYRVATNDRHDVKGYGLGLYYVKTVLDKHRGSITVTSTPGEGSVFTVCLPMVQNTRI